jgi:type IV secretory pathway component VirB8
MWTTSARHSSLNAAYAFICARVNHSPNTHASYRVMTPCYIKTDETDLRSIGGKHRSFIQYLSPVILLLLYLICSFIYLNLLMPINTFKFYYVQQNHRKSSFKRRQKSRRAAIIDCSQNK